MRGVIMLCAALFSPLGLTITCFEEIDETTPTNRFIQYDNGTVRDNVTQLVWMRCAVGQSWDATNEQCSGDPIKYTWQGALQYAHGLIYADARGWRLPNIKELASLVERQCARPSINIEVFDNTAADDYWSSTPSLIELDAAWVVAFDSGSNALKDKQLATYIRLVRIAN